MARGPVRRRLAHMRLNWKKVGIKPPDPNGGDYLAAIQKYHPPTVFVREVPESTYPERLREYNRKQRALKRAKKGRSHGPK